MSESIWTIREHVIPASHIRGFRRGIRDEQNGRLRLAVKQYTPKDRPTSKPGDVTLIMSSGLGASKELHEPFYDELFQRGLPIRAIWSMDTAQHGASYLLNEGIIGDEPNWFDSSRDLLQMINHFQKLLPPPLVAIGSSWGCVAIVSLAVFHPRMFAGIINMEPTFATTLAIRRIDRTDTGIDRSHRAMAMAKRKDIWPSLEDARSRLRKTPHFGSFDPRVFERVMKYDLRPAPLERCAEVGSHDAVILTTPKSMETGTMMRPDPPLSGNPEAPDFKNRPEDIDTTVVRGFYRGEVVQVYRDLPYVLPATLYIWGDRSFGGTSYAEAIAGRTGIGYGGNGGVTSGGVHAKTMNNTGHNITLEKPAEAAETVEPWLLDRIAWWNKEAQESQNEPDFDIALRGEFMQRIAKL